MLPETSVYPQSLDSREKRAKGTILHFLVCAVYKLEVLNSVLPVAITGATSAVAEV